MLEWCQNTVEHSTALQNDSLRCPKPTGMFKASACLAFRPPSHPVRQQAAAAGDAADEAVEVVQLCADLAEPHACGGGRSRSSRGGGFDARCQLSVSRFHLGCQLAGQLDGQSCEWAW